MNFRSAVLLALLAYAPWHDAISLGQRPEISFFPELHLPYVALPGLFNALWILLVGGVLGYSLVKSWIKERPTLAEIGIALFPLFTLFRIERPDMFTWVMVLNSFFFTILILAFLRRYLFLKEQAVLQKWGVRVLGLSLGLAILLPLLIKIEGYRVFEKFGPIFRFRGWVGEGEPIALAGSALVIWAGLKILWVLKNAPAQSLKVNRFWIFENGLALALGFLAIHLNVLRISLITAGVFCLIASFYAFRLKLRPRKWIATAVFLALTAFSVISFVTGNFAIKNMDRGGFAYIDPEKRKMDQWNSLEYLTYIFDGNGKDIYDRYENPSNTLLQGTERRSLLWGIFNLRKDLRPLDRVIVSNNRVFTWQYLLDNIGEATLFGRGTGSSKRFLVEQNFLTPEPACDYLRIFFELGYFGFFLFMGLLGITLWQLRHQPGFAAVLALAVSLMTDVVLVIPTFGYGIMLMAVLGFYAETKKSIGYGAV